MKKRKETLLTHHYASGTHHFTQHICFLSLNKKELEGKHFFDYLPRMRGKTIKNLDEKRKKMKVKTINFNFYSRLWTPFEKRLQKRKLSFLFDSEIFVCLF